MNPEEGKTLGEVCEEEIAKLDELFEAAYLVYTNDHHRHDGNEVEKHLFALRSAVNFAFSAGQDASRRHPKMMDGPCGDPKCGCSKPAPDAKGECKHEWVGTMSAVLPPKEIETHCGICGVVRFPSPGKAGGE